MRQQAEPGARQLMAAEALPESRYLRYLPGVYRQDPFVRRLLLVFEAVLGPLETMVDNLPLYTEPGTAPTEFLPWLAHWVTLALDAAWPLERQRALIAHAVEIYRWRGTRRGLKLHIQAYTGIEPLIQEYCDGFVISTESRLGWTTPLASAPQPNTFVVTVPVADPGAVDEAVLRAIIDEDKPAHTIYALHVIPVSLTALDRMAAAPALDAVRQNGDRRRPTAHAPDATRQREPHDEQ